MEYYQTGDLILFKGRGYLSWLIEYFGKCKYSHIGRDFSITKSNIFHASLRYEPSLRMKPKPNIFINISDVYIYKK